MLSFRHLSSSSSLLMPARRSVLKHFFVGTTCGVIHEYRMLHR